MFLIELNERMDLKNFKNFYFDFELHNRGFALDENFILNQKILLKV